MYIFQGLLKKHQAFETDLDVHRERVRDIENSGNQLIGEVCRLSLNVQLDFKLLC